MLTRVNGPDPWAGPSPELSFKTIIITFSLGSILESSFKIMIIIVFIIIQDIKLYLSLYLIKNSNK
jgi:hypothetical protein